MSLSYVKPEHIMLKSHPLFTEKWLHAMRRVEWTVSYATVATTPRSQCAFTV